MPRRQQLHPIRGIGLVTALGDGHALLRTSIASHLDHIEAVMHRAAHRRRNPWWRTNE